MLRVTPLNVLLAIALVPALSAQAPATNRLQRAAATITAADIAHHIGVIADDSMMGRDPLTRGLEMTAQYVADHFKKAGLTPGGDTGTWFQHYAGAGEGRRRLDFAQSRVTFAAGGREAVASFTSDIYLALGTIPTALAPTGTVLVTGRYADTVAPAAAKDRVVLYVAPPGLNREQRRQILEALAEGSKGVIDLDGSDSALFAKRVHMKTQSWAVTIDDSWGAYLWPRQAVRAVFAAGGLDLAKVRADTTPSVRPLPGLTVRLEQKNGIAQDMNTVGFLEGSDPVLKHEYIVLTAHMDAQGMELYREPDGIYNGADDDASGTASLIALARAFTQRGVRPRRSLIFLGDSDEEGGLPSGSHYFVWHPPVPIEQIVADVNLDMIGRGPKDSVVVAGLKHSDLGALFERTNARHPELKLSPAADSSDTEMRFTDAVHFIHRGVPMIGFADTRKWSPDQHLVTDSPEKIDAEREARIVRLAFYVTQAIANQDQRPQWNSESYKSWVQKP